MKILVSACLLGHPVRYDGRGALATLERLEPWRDRFIPACPEGLGGLGTPRAPAEIEAGASARDVIAGDAKVWTREGEDVTEAFMEGARRAGALALKLGVEVAILKSRSPSCGVHERYDGTFSGRRIAGAGITATWLELHGVQVFSERELEAARAFLTAHYGLS